MAKIERFEQIEAWRRGRELAKAIYSATSRSGFSRDYGLKEQMRRAVVSVLSNIAEGFERGGNREFVQYLSLAKGSVGEVKAQLYVALDAGYLEEVTFATLYDLADETGRLIGGFMRYLSASTYKGNKFK